MLMIQIVKELSDIDFKYPATSAVHHLVAEGIQRLVRRSARPKAVGAVQEVLLVDWLQQHDDRTLKDFVLQRGNSKWAGLGCRATLWNMHAPHGRSVVRAGFGAVEQSLKVALQFSLIFLRGHSVHAH